jgi:hypothetical protein
MLNSADSSITGQRNKISDELKTVLNLLKACKIEQLFLYVGNDTFFENVNKVIDIFEI